MLTLYQQHHYSVCFFCQNAPQGAPSETNTSPTAGIPEVEALKAKVAELEAKNAALEAKDTLHKAKIAELEAKDALRNEENAALRQENARLKVSAENHVCINTGSCVLTCENSDVCQGALWLL